MLLGKPKNYGYEQHPRNHRGLMKFFFIVFIGIIGFILVSTFYIDFSITGKKVFSGYLEKSGSLTGGNPRFNGPRKMVIADGKIGLGNYPSADFDIIGSGIRISSMVNTGIETIYPSGIILWDQGYLYLGTGNDLLSKKQLTW